MYIKDIITSVRQQTLSIWWKTRSVDNSYLTNPVPYASEWLWEYIRPGRQWEPNIFFFRSASYKCRHYGADFLHRQSHTILNIGVCKGKGGGGGIMLLPKADFGRLLVSPPMIKCNRSNSYGKCYNNLPWKIHHFEVFFRFSQCSTPHPKELSWVGQI